MAGDAVRLSVQPSSGCADQPGEGAVRAPSRGRFRRSRPVHAPATAAAAARSHPNRGSAGAVDAGVQDRSTLAVDASDRHATLSDGTLTAGGLPPRRADTACRRAARQGTSAGGGPAHRRRAGYGPRLHGDSRLWAVVLPECEGRVLEEAGEFRLERWLNKSASGCPAHVYMPFSYGPRRCAAWEFCMMEGAYLLASIAQRLRIEPASSRPVESDFKIIYDVRGSLPVVVRERSH